MSNRVLMPGTKAFVFGSVWTSFSFWFVATTSITALWRLVGIWWSMRRIDTLTPPDADFLFLMAFFLIVGLAVFFRMFLPLRREAQAETAEETRELITAWADIAVQMLYVLVGGVFLASMLWLLALRGR
jgi:hypothetical protein